tara:strand:+ start:256 stop:768 length:513 start_codon:yes stop_codon:yes gene_type:complete
MATNLEFIKSASGTSVSSLSVTDCFSDTYDVYMVSITKLDQSAQDYIEARLIDSVGIDSTSNYDFASLELLAAGSFTEKRNTGQTGWATSISYQNTGADDGVGITMYVFNPNDSSSYTFVKSHSSAYYSGGGLGYKMIGVHKVAEQITGINFFPRSGTLDNMTINVYGVK